LPAKKVGHELSYPARESFRWQPPGKPQAGVFLYRAIIKKFKKSGGKNMTEQQMHAMVWGSMSKTPEILTCGGRM
jgi:hypothetical protein